ncbi:hypothetical protein SAMN04488132_10624 [Sediminibacterium ginsengisoli]|uniref:Uncharacterized protein n=1 Tax=Sediminibacterium ginsengisoli TaxID=413434 RepID=A0A1T4PIF4_9BACT|nr:hypothetical protein SAMN04488132_10624 [Sediminibacterium ginsengisoli]
MENTDQPTRQSLHPANIAIIVLIAITVLALSYFEWRSSH